MAQKKDNCVGCEDNFYNGCNPYGIKECSRFKEARKAKVCIASMNEHPPFQRVESKLNCYHQKGYVYLKNFDKITKGKYKGLYCYAGDASYWIDKD